MSATLFDMPDQSSGGTIAAYRAALDRAVETAKKEAAWHHRIADIEGIEEEIDELAKTGDADWARDQIRDCFDTDTPEGMRACADVLENIDLIAIAWWKLAKAERRGA